MGYMGEQNPEQDDQTEMLRKLRTRLQSTDIGVKTRISHAEEELVRLRGTHQGLEVAISYIDDEIKLKEVNHAV